MSYEPLTPLGAIATHSSSPKKGEIICVLEV